MVVCGSARSSRQRDRREPELAPVDRDDAGPRLGAVAQGQLDVLPTPASRERATSVPTAIVRPVEAIEAACPDVEVQDPGGLRRQDHRALGLDLRVAEHLVRPHHGRRGQRRGRSHAVHVAHLVGQVAAGYRRAAPAGDAELGGRGVADAVGAGAQQRGVRDRVGQGEDHEHRRGGDDAGEPRREDPHVRDREPRRRRRPRGTRPATASLTRRSRPGAATANPIAARIPAVDVTAAPSSEGREQRGGRQRTGSQHDQQPDAFAEAGRLPGLGGGLRHGVDRRHPRHRPGRRPGRELGHDDHRRDAGQRRQRADGQRQRLRQDAGRAQQVAEPAGEQ